MKDKFEVCLTDYTTRSNFQQFEYGDSIFFGKFRKSLSGTEIRLMRKLCVTAIFTLPRGTFLLTRHLKLMNTQTITILPNVQCTARISTGQTEDEQVTQATSDLL